MSPRTAERYRRGAATVRSEGVPASVLPARAAPAAAAAPPAVAGGGGGGGGGGRLRRQHLELDEERQVVGGDVRMRTAEHLVVPVPLLVEGTEHAERTEEVAGVEDVVDDALEVKPAAAHRDAR